VYVYKEGMTMNKISPIHANFEEIETFLNEGGNPNFQDERGLTLIHCIRNTKAISLLLEAGADPNLQDENGDTPLHLLISLYEFQISGDRKYPDTPQMMSLLLDAGANPHFENHKGVTPFQEASDEIKTLINEHEAKQLAKAIEDSPEPIKSAPVRVRM